MQALDIVEGGSMCAKYRKYDIEQTCFIMVDFMAIKNNNPLLRAIDHFVEEHVSVEQFSKTVKNDDGGAPAVHPKMMLKMLFYSYANGIYSSREIEDRLRWDPNYVYLSANQNVDHSTICNFILKYKAEIKALFSKLVYVIAKMGYITMEFTAVDGTKIKANVGKKFTGDVVEFENKRKKIEEKIEQILQHTTSEELNEKYKARRVNKLNDLRREKERIEAFLTKVEKSENKKEIIDGKINLTDPDARMVKDNETMYMGYNCQVAVDEKAHVIIGTEVFNDASDRGLLQPMVEEIETQTKKDLQKTELGFDAGYFSSENLQYCNARKLNVYLPEGKGEAGVKQRKCEIIESRDCKLELDRKIKRLICPGGQIMETTNACGDRGNYFYRFYPEKEYCQSCQFSEKCYKNVNRKKRFSVKREYFDALPLREQMTEKLSALKGKQRIADRSCIIEHVFGEIKEIFKFRRFMHRTLQKVRVIWTIVCIAYNFRKLARLAYDDEN